MQQGKSGHFCHLGSRGGTQDEVFIFCAFAPRDALKMNQAEFIHAGWVYRGRPNLSIA